MGEAFGDDFGVKRGCNGRSEWAAKKTVAMGREKPYKNGPIALVPMVRLKAELPEGRGAQKQKL